jgi:hypothetical protein
LSPLAVGGIFGEDRAERRDLMRGGEEPRGTIHANRSLRLGHLVGMFSTKLADEKKKVGDDVLSSFVAHLFH